MDLDLSKINIEHAAPIIQLKRPHSSKNGPQLPMTEDTQEPIAPENNSSSLRQASNLSMMVLGGFIAAVGIAAVALAFVVFNPVALGVGISLGAAGIFAGVGLFAVGVYRAVKASPCRVESAESIAMEL